MQYFLSILSVSVVIIIASTYYIQGHKEIKSKLRRLLGFSKDKITRLLKELKRKAWHLVGLLIPVIYWFTLQFHVLTRKQFKMVLGTVMAISILIDLGRLYVPPFRTFYMKYFGSMLRESESHRFSGTTNFMIGCWLTCMIFPVFTAITSCMYLIIGDMVAAMVGMSFGKTKIRANGKSLEGTLACFVACFLITQITFWPIHLSEYIAFCGAIFATLAELFTDYLRMDDNFSIPLFGGLGLVLAQIRLWKFLWLPPEMISHEKYH
mmetsp:Transcript_1093/g.1691  ORF Transcript_1093/g.1691 Transcript_1093/m.1691 type:complete len:265 (-) Transcript_1093:64-858(-)